MQEKWNQLLAGKRALITGGSAGIGKAVALQFALQGAQVCLMGTNQEKGEQAVADINQQVGSACASFIPVDVASKKEVDAAVNTALQQYGGIDILVNNAGITRDQLLIKMSEEDWDRVLAVNLKSCYNLCQALSRTMIKARKGKIINMSSVVGLIGNPGQANYCASKAAMIGFTKALAKELASRNICVNAIAPGFVDTQMTQALTDLQKEAVLGKIPLGRMGQAEEIAYAALFLASYLSDYITGQVLTVDGGMVM